MRTRWISPQFISTNRVDSVAELRGAAGDGRRVNAGAGHRHQRDPHGVVLRAEGPAVLRDRLPPARASAPGTSTRPATTSTSTGSGPTRSCTARVGARPVPAATRPGSSRCGRTATARSPGTRASTRPRRRLGEWVIDAHLPPPGRRPSRSRPATWPTRTSGCATPTTTSCTGMLDDVGRDGARARRGERVDPLLGPQRRPSVGPRWSGRWTSPTAVRDGHRGLAGAGGRRRRAGLPARRRRGEPAAVRPLAGRAASATPSTPTPSSRTGRCSTSCRTLYRLQLEHAWQAGDRDPAQRHAARGRRTRRWPTRRPAVRLLDERHLDRVRRGRTPTSTRPGARTSGRRSPSTAPRSRATWRGARGAGGRPAATSACCCRRAAPVRRSPAPAAVRRLVGRGDGAHRPGRAVPRPRRARARRAPRSSSAGSAWSRGWCCCRTPAAGCASTTRAGWARWPAGSPRPAAWCWTTASGSTWTAAAELPPDARVVDADGRIAAGGALA